MGNSQNRFHFVHYRPIRRESGSVLLQALVVLAVLLSLSAAFYSSLQTAIAEAKALEVQLEKNDLLAWVSDALASPEACRFTLKDGNANPSFDLNDPTSTAQIDSIYMGPSLNSLKVAELGRTLDRLGSEIQVDRITIGKLTCSKTPTSACEPTPDVRILDASLTIETSVNSRPLAPIEVPFEVRLNSTNPAAAIVSDCSLKPELDTLSICKSLNMTYDPATDTCLGTPGGGNAGPPPAPKFRYLLTAAPGSFAQASGECDVVSPAPSEYSLANKTRIYRGNISICFWKAPL